MYFKRLFTEENNKYTVDKCNRWSDAVAKIDESDEQYEYLSNDAKDKQIQLQSLETKCEDLINNIKTSK